MNDPVQAFGDAEQALFAAHRLTVKERWLELETPKLKTRVLECGEGEPLVLVHGGGAFASVWAPLMAELRGHRVYAVDRPGCGLTDAFDYRGSDLKQHAVDFVRGVLDGLGLKSAHLVANCAGGLFSLAFTLAHPERVKSLCLPGMAAGTDPWLPLPSRLLGLRGLNLFLARTAFRPSPASARKSYELLFAGDKANLTPELLETAYRAQCLPGAEHSFLTLMERITRLGGLKHELDLRAQLPSIHVPTLFIAGTKSFFGPVSVTEAAARSMPAGQCAVLQGAGHFAWLDAARTCGDLIRAFVAEQDAFSNVRPGRSA